jgi:hypothetical protein
MEDALGEQAGGPGFVGERLALERLYLALAMASKRQRKREVQPTGKYPLADGGREA